MLHTLFLDSINTVDAIHRLYMYTTRLDYRRPCKKEQMKVQVSEVSGLARFLIHIWKCLLKSSISSLVASRRSHLNIQRSNVSRISSCSRWPGGRFEIVNVGRGFGAPMAHSMAGTNAYMFGSRRSDLYPMTVIIAIISVNIA